jgi:hypothetical protein
MLVIIPSYTGNTDGRNFGPGWPRLEVRPYLKNNQHKKGWWSGSNGITLSSTPSISK